MFDIFGIPLINSVLSWVVLGVLAWIVAMLRKFTKHMQLMERSNKSLMRSDLIERYKRWRDNGCWVGDANKDEWLTDYEVYHELNGKNGFIDAAYEEIKTMPSRGVTLGGE